MKTKELSQAVVRRRESALHVLVLEPAHGFSSFCDKIKIIEVNGYTAMELRDKEGGVIRVVNAKYVVQITPNEYKMR